MSCVQFSPVTPFVVAEQDGVFINAYLSNLQLQKLLSRRDYDPTVEALKAILLDPTCPYFSNWDELEGHLKQKGFNDPLRLWARDKVLF
jgi:hypothetical protein